MLIMNKNRMQIIIFFLLLKTLKCGTRQKRSSTFVPEKYRSWTEKELIKSLLYKYDRRSRPTVDNETPIYTVPQTNMSIQQITVEFGLSLIQIMELNEMDQILTSNVRTLYRWKDYHLRWNPEQYDNITHVHIPTKKIWLPDISIYNYADERMEERRDCDAVIKYDGTVEWHPTAIFKSTCPVRIKFFPFDRQCCKLKFGPWTYDGFRVNITFYDSRSSLDLTNLEKNAEWELIDSHAKFTNTVYQCCVEPYPDISFHILLERNPAFYNYILIIPCFLLSSLTLVLFWLPPESPAKMVLGMNVFIAFFLLVVLLEKSIPSASISFPLIGTYYCVNMTLITLSTFLCLITVNFHFRGDNRKEVPYWLKKLTLKHGARILFVDLGSMLKTSTYTVEKPPKRVKSPPAYKEVQRAYPLGEFMNKGIPPQFYDFYYQMNNSQRFQSSNPNYLHTNHLRQGFETAETRNSRANTPDCAAAASSAFDRYPPPESSSENEEEEIDHEVEFQHQKQEQKSSYFFKDYEDDLEEFLAECVQSPPPSRLAASWASYNSAAEFSSSFRQERAQGSCSRIHSGGLPYDRSYSNRHSCTPTNIFIARRVNLITKDINDVIKDLIAIQKTNENRDRVNKIVSEWRAVGMVLDRFFFMVYVIAIILSLLLFFPKAGDGDFKDKNNNLDCQSND